MAACSDMNSPASLSRRPGIRRVFNPATEWRSTRYIGTALLAGATLCFAEGLGRQHDAAMPGRLLQQMRITHVDLPPALLPYLDEQTVPECLSTIIIGGEVCSPAVIRRWAAKLQIINVYGPTEATICTSMTLCDEHWDRAWIGDPLPGVVYRVCNADGIELTTGSPGELRISGEAVALGYPWLPELSAKRFVDDGRTFRTGDLVVRHENGRIEFLGRVDRQLKLRGLLICPEEVEAALLGTGLVRRAHVLPWQRGDRSLLAACVEMANTCVGDQAEDPESPGSATGGLRAALEPVLPDWMIPAAWCVTRRMPCNTSGKPDAESIRHLLDQQTGARPGPGPASHRELTLEERQVAALFEESLGLVVVAENADFFTDLGGDSLAVLAVIALATERGLPLPPDALYRGRTVAGVARLLSRQMIGPAESFVRPAQGANARPLGHGPVRRPDVHEMGEAMSRRLLFREVESAAAALEGLDPTAPATSHAADPRLILLTGAGGFLGGAVLGELLLQSDADVVCLGRGPAEGLHRRISHSAADHGFEAVLNTNRSRWHALTGDITQPRFGLEQYRWRQLTDDVGVVVHLAAAVKLFEPYDLLKPTQVDGTIQVLRLCAEGRAKSLHAASSLSVFVDADPLVPVCREQDLRRGVERVHGGYAQSKWVAEQLLLRARERGLAVSIFRLGLLGPNSRTGAGPRQDWLTLALPGLAELTGTLSLRPDLAFDLTPVDYAARALVHLAMNAAPDVYHLANPTPVTQARIAALKSSPPDAGTAQRRPDPGPGRHAAALAGIRARTGSDSRFHRSLDLFKATRLRFDCSRAAAALQAGAIEFPEITSEYLRLCLRHAETHHLT